MIRNPFVEIFVPKNSIILVLEDNISNKIVLIDTGVIAQIYVEGIAQSNLFEEIFVS